MDSHDKKHTEPREDPASHEVKIFREEDFAKGKTPTKSSRNRWKNPNFISSLDFAITGFVTAVKEEKNMRKHLVMAILALIAGFVFQIGRLDWVLLLLSIILVISAELINSAIENVVDLASDYQFHMRAKRAKDMAAAAVLVTSGFAIVSGIFIFGPEVWKLMMRLF